jgi:nitroreductase
MTDILNLIKDRQSSRVPFDANRKINKEDLQKILEAGSWAPTAHNMQNFEIMVVDDKKIMDKIANIKQPISLTFIKENYNQLSFSVEELKKRKTGVLGTMFPPSWRNPDVTMEDIMKDNHGQNDHNQMMDTPLLLMVLYDPKRRAPASEGDFLGIMSLGCMMENMWLMASSLGIGFHVVSSLSEGNIEKEIKKMLNIPDHLMIAISYRLGYPVKPYNYLRVRRDIDDFCHFNNYNTKRIETLVSASI